MLGAMVADCLARDPDIDLTVTARDRERPGVAGPAREAHCLPFDAESPQDSLAPLLAQRYDWIVNAIGIIKPHINEADPRTTERAIRVNALFPHRLAEAAARAGSRVLQIATDCVYSGTEGHCRETAPHDALDVYGKSKSLGEAPSPAIHHLRCSIIGPELKSHVSLLDWFRGQPAESVLTGFTNHRWNGVTTLAFARICRGIVHGYPRLPARQHVVPTGTVTKAEMLEGFARVFNRPDLVIRHGEAPTVVDRTLATDAEATNRLLWEGAGYPAPPTFAEMLAELGAYPFNR